MTASPGRHVAQCRCGKVEITAFAEPILVTACYCDDCQAAARQLSAEAGGLPVATADGGTEFMLFRRDRIALTRGAEHLRTFRLKDGSKTRRMVAGCCGTPLYVTFDTPRPWVSAFRTPFGPDAPPVTMRICTRFREAPEPLDASLPAYPGYPAAMIAPILLAGLAMLFSRPVGELP